MQQRGLDIDHVSWDRHSTTAGMQGFSRSTSTSIKEYFSYNSDQMMLYSKPRTSFRISNPLKINYFIYLFEKNFDSDDTNITISAIYFREIRCIFRDRFDY